MPYLFTMRWLEVLWGVRPAFTYRITDPTMVVIEVVPWWSL